MKTISAKTFLERINPESIVFDTRTQLQFKRDGLSQAKHLRLESLQKGELPDICKTSEVYLLCEYGQISELAGLYLENAGFTKVFNVMGGMKALSESAKLNYE